MLHTHIGVEKDIALAKMLDPDWGVDLIIGGHSHTFMEEPVISNGIPIVQAGTGTGCIGRADIKYDTVERVPAEINWKCVKIDEDTAPVDPIMEELVDSYRNETDT